MNATPYTYCIVRYVHDPTAGEALNIGVLLYAPSVPYVAARLDHRYARLSETFAEFDGESFRRTLQGLHAAIKQFKERWSGSFPALRDLPPDAGTLGTQIWPDADLSFRFGPTLAGVSRDLEETLQHLFVRFVTSQHAQPREERRSDRDVWAVYQRPLSLKAVKAALQPKTIKTPEFEMEFDHAFKNGRWHVLQPISMDYVKAETIQSKASRWLGNAMALHGHPDLEKLYLLLGRPRLASQRQAYERAKALLNKIPVAHEIIEETEAEAFAERIAGYMSAHGIIVPADDAEKT